MNVTLSIEDELVARARQIARAQGTSLNEMIRSYLRAVAGETPADDLADALQRLWEEEPGRSGGYVFRRDDAYEGRT